MQYYPFEKRRELLVFCCTHVLEDGKVITCASHHFDDNNWVFTCDGEHSDCDAVITTIGEVLDLDPSVTLLSDLPVGCRATRKNKRYMWKKERIAGEKSYNTEL